MRLFIAIELSPEVRARLVKMQDAVRKLAPNLSFTRPDNLHLTLKFLGEVPDADMKGVTDALGGIAPVGDFAMTTGGIVCFPQRGRVRVVGAAVEAAPSLTHLHQQIESVLNGKGFAREHRGYHPHITLARARTPLAASMRESLARASAPLGRGATMQVNDFVLMETRLHPQGARYTPAARFYIKLPDKQGNL